MSILIRGMEMPKSCFYCPMRWKVDPDNIKCLATGEVFEETFTATIETRNAGNCPLVEVPPHGRLIDADAFLAIINDSTILSDFLKCIINPLIRGEPTVLPADKAEEGET